MSIVCSTTNQAADRVRADLLVVGAYADGQPAPGADAVDTALDGGLRAFLLEAAFTGKPGETLAVPTAGRLGAKAALVVGLGPRDEVDLVTLRRAAAAAARRATKATSLATTLALAGPEGLDRRAAARAVAEGLALGGYQYLEFKSEPKASALRRALLLGVQGADSALAAARVVTDAVCWARDMVNTPAGQLAPADFAAAARRLLSGKGVTLTVLTEAQLRAQKMGGVIGVGQGSARPPRFVKAVYEPAGAKATGAKRAGTLALVGKGVVFDSGGLSLKPAGGMETMKTDMSGAAAVLATMSTLKALGVRNRVVAYAPMVENMPSGEAIRPGDVLRMRSGTTVEVLNTDAEGRLILADALSWAVADGADAIVDVATLTGACMVALGEKVAGVMGNHDEWIGSVRGAADRVGEPVWPLPLPKDYRKLMDSEVADLRNISTSSYGGALTAGIFLEAFVDDVPWAHLDIAGPARAPADDGELVKGGTGFGVRTLAELALRFEAPARPVKAKTKAPARKAPARTARTRKAAGAKRAGKPAKRS